MIGMPVVGNVLGQIIGAVVGVVILLLSMDTQACDRFENRRSSAGRHVTQTFQ